MATIKCFYCNLLLPQNTLNSHLRSKHSPPSAADIANFHGNFAGPIVIPPKGMLNRVTNIPPKAAAPVPAPLQGEESTLYSDWSKGKASKYVSVDDVAYSRVIRTDGPQKTAAMLDKAVRYDVQEMVRAFDRLSNEVRDACCEHARTTYVFPVSLLTLIGEKNRGLN